jgi:hypothetical protein
VVVNINSTLINNELFCKTFGFSSSSSLSKYPILLGNLDTINVLFPNSTDDIIHVSGDKIINIAFNKTKLNEYSPTDISQKIDDFTRLIFIFPPFRR